MPLFRLRVGPRRASRGLSLVETMVGMLIAAVLVSLAAPAWRDFLLRQRIASVRTELVAAIHLARWEAVRRNAPVVLQQRTDCGVQSALAPGWACGWEVRAMSPGDAQPLQSFALPAGVQLSHAGGAPAMEFSRSGMPTLVAHKFVIAASHVGAPFHDALCINRTGRVRTVTGRTTC